MILHIRFSRNVTFIPSPDAFVVYFLFSQSHRRCVERQKPEPTELLALDNALVR
jgi:hypothetical protein